jgi:hypothetical protein
MKRCRNTPAAVQRQLRQEAHFGCCRCGHPLLDNAHIIPYSISHAFPPEDMLALCPTCHRIADDGDYSEKYLMELKANLRNKGSVSERFLIEGNDLILNIAGNRFINCATVLKINDYKIITMKRESEGYVTFDLKLYDNNNNLIADVDENKWTINTSLVWDLEYKPRHLKIRNAPRQIYFDLRIENNQVFIEGNMYYLGEPIVMTGDDVQIENSSVFGFMKGCTIQNAGTAINYRIIGK